MDIIVGYCHCNLAYKPSNAGLFGQIRFFSEPNQDKVRVHAAQFI